MKLNTLLGVSFFLFFLFACGEDNSSSPEQLPISSSEESLSSDEPLSSSIVQSSSSEASSSSISYSINSHIAWNYLNPAISYGEFTDERDGQVYKYIEHRNYKIMTENLNYADSIKNPNLMGSTWCLDNNLDSCSKYGRYYTWAAAVNLDSTYNMKGANLGNYYFIEHQGICPDGWFIFISERLWKDIIFDNTNNPNQLCARKGWDTDVCTDENGFAALPNGFYENGSFVNVGKVFTYWSMIFEQRMEASLGFLSIKDIPDSTHVDYWGALSMDKKIGSAVRCMRFIPTSSSNMVSSSSQSEAMLSSSN